MVSVVFKSPSQYNCKNLTISRASVTEKNLKDYQEIFSYLVKNNYSEILKHPSRIYNGDETAFFLSPKGGKVLFSFWCYDGQT